MNNGAMVLITSFCQSLRIILTTILYNMNTGLLISMWIISSVYNIRAVDTCVFPAGLSGTWYQTEFQERIIISQDTISNKGRCKQNDTDKFLLEDSKEKCFRCLVLLPKHANFLQYKESLCESLDNLEQLCDKIGGDSRLYSMFRVSGTPVKCPFKGPFKFSYDSGEGECKSPESTMDLCTDPSVVSLKFQACTDVTPSERKDIKMHCLGMWKESHLNYLVAELHQQMYGDNERYRCFLYEETNNGDFYMSQSADGSCQAMTSPREGHLTMKLRKRNPDQSKGHYRQANCRFPEWMTKNHQWHTLNNKWKYIMARSNSTLRVVNANHEKVITDETNLDKLEMEATCYQEVEGAENRFMIVAFALTKCDNNFICLNFIKRSKQVVQLQKGMTTQNPAEACNPENFDNNTDYITLIVSSLESGECPYSGRYSILTPDNPCDKPPKANFGCDGLQLIKIVDNCGIATKHEIVYHCHGFWDDRGLKYLIASEKKGEPKRCFIYKEENDVIKVSSIPGTCKLDPDSTPSGIMKYRVTPEGQCAITGDVASSLEFHFTSFLIILLAILL